MIDCAPLPEITSWNYFVSNEQILRHGLAISANRKFDRRQALLLGDKIQDSIDALINTVRVAVEAIEGARDFQVLSPVAVNKNEKVIVNFPSFACVIGRRNYAFSISATICQGDTNSKIWVKISLYEDEAALAKDLAARLINIAYDFYTECAALVHEKVTFQKRFWFEILGAYTTDYALTDVFQILQGSANPAATFDVLQRKGKLSPVARLFKFAGGEDMFADAEKLKAHWLEANVEHGPKASSVTYMSVKQNEAIVLIEADESESTLRAWGLCYSDTADFDVAPPVREAATQLTGKLASVLAADL